MGFSKTFVWGAAVSAADVEGGSREGGKGKNTLDVLAGTPGGVQDGYTPDDGCDGFYRYADDIALMKKMGIRALLFSPDWSRILPEGTGNVSAEGLGFYDRFVDKLLDANITPYMTLFDGALPASLQEQGGFENPAIVDWFGTYAGLVATHFSDRVRHFFTIDDPIKALQVVQSSKTALTSTLLCAHHLLMANGRAVLELRRNARQPIEIGFSLSGSVPFPQTENPEDIRAAKAALFAVPADPARLLTSLSWWADPVLLGHYPAAALEKFERDLPKIREDDMALIHQKIDLLGLGALRGFPVRKGENGKWKSVRLPAGFPRKASGQPITPKVYYWGPKFLYERYRVPVMITGNGISCCDRVFLDGAVHDPTRIDTLSRYLGQLKRAAGETDVRGYFVKSLMDGFEGRKGYTQRQGLWYVDFETKRRIPKDSAYWYRDIISTNGRDL